MNCKFNKSSVHECGSYQCATANRCCYPYDKFVSLNPVPDEVQKVCDEINRDLNYSKETVKLVPYLMRERDPVDWRVKIFRLPDQMLLVDYLVPEKLDRHTVMLFLGAIKRQGEIEFKRGQENAVNILSQKFKEWLPL